MLAILNLICTYFGRRRFFSRICDHIANFSCSIPYIAKTNIISSSPLMDQNNFFYGQVMKRTWWTANNEWRILVFMWERHNLIQAVVERPFLMQSDEWKISDKGIYELKITWGEQTTPIPHIFWVFLGFTNRGSKESIIPSSAALYQVKNNSGQNIQGKLLSLWENIPQFFWEGLLNKSCGQRWRWQKRRQKFRPVKPLKFIQVSSTG